MLMTEKLASDLLDCLTCLAISANGRLPNEEQLEQSRKYAINTLSRLCNEWEEIMGEGWEVY